MVADYFCHHEGEELLGEHGVEPGILRQRPQPLNLARFTPPIRGGKPEFSLEYADLLGRFEALGHQVHQG